MSNPLLEQLDDIHFSYGLVLFLLGAVCLSMSRGSSLQPLVAPRRLRPRAWRLPEWFRFHIVEDDVELANFLLRAGAGDVATPPRRQVGLSRLLQHG